MLIDSLGHGGAQRQFVGLSKGLKEAGYIVEVIYYHDINFYLKDLQKAGISTHLIQAKNKIIGRLKEIKKYVKTLEPDLIISYLTSPSILACLLKLTGFRGKIIVSERNITKKLDGKAQFRFHLFRLSDLVISNSNFQTNFIQTNFRFLKNKAVTIINFTDLDYFIPQFHEKNEIPQICIVASLLPSKNPINLIYACGRLKRMGYKFNVKWYGESKNEKQYADLCRQEILNQHIEDIFTIHERTSEIKSVYNESDFFCLPSFYEGTPNALCEAMACGLPVVASDVSNNAVFIKENKNGFLIKNPDDFNEIAEVLLKCLKLDHASILEFGLNSRKKAEEMLSYNRFMEEYKEVIENLFV